MSDVFELFEWSRHEGGYQIVDKIPHPIVGGLRLTNRDDDIQPEFVEPRRFQRPERMIIPIHPRAKRIPYHPLSRQYSGLLKTAATIDLANESSVLAFTNAHGFLGVNFVSVPIRADVKTRTIFVPAEAPTEERLLDWIEQITAFQRASHDVDAAWGGKAERDVYDRLNTGLQVYAPERVWWDATTHENRWGPVPVSLLGVLWHQLAQSFTYQLSFRSCRVCRRQFQIGGRDTGKRSDSEFCSQACKSKDYRERKVQAQHLAAQGVSLSAIAEKLRTDVRTLRHWVGVTTKRRTKGR
jgi:hypothetical protein